MPAPIVLGIIAATTALTGLKKGTDGIKKSQKADDIQKEVQKILDLSKKRMENNRKKTSESIQDLGKEKLEAAGVELKVFIENFSKIKNIKLSDCNILDECKNLGLSSNVELKSIKITVLNASDILSSGITGVGAGILLGWGTYGGVMALGSASTGTAIAGLSGVAATNATLAWLGGGAIAAGGGGMALGTAVLGGIIAGPALLIAGGIFDAKAKEKLNNAYSNLAKAKKIESDIEKGIVELNYIRFTANQVKNLLSKIRKYSYLSNYEMTKIIRKKTNWELFSQSEKETIAIAVKQIQLIKKIIDTPLLSKEGTITPEIKKVEKIHF